MKSSEIIARFAKPFLHTLGRQGSSLFAKQTLRRAILERYIARFNVSLYTRKRSNFEGQYKPTFLKLPFF
ncbi:hypothetical protein PMI37_04820 [Pseudomonas sp. GM80]|nr:hypothetical protein PMI37_04820 [Pseudomonas sp. GM80]